MPARNFWFKLLFKLLFFSALVFIFLFTPKSAFADWVKYSGNPIFSPSLSWEGQNAKSPMLISDGMEYKMWYVGNDGSGWRIGYANSNNGITGWKKPTNSPVIDIKAEVVDDWQERDVHEPFVIYDQTEGYKMWYSSVGTNWQGGPDRFRLRYATSGNGIDWDEKDWVLRGTPGKWDGGGLYRGHSIIKTKTGYQMWYAGTESWSWKWKIGYAISSDGINWEKQNDGNPVIEPSSPWENVYFPKVIFENGIYEMWYARGADNLPLPTQIVYATSTDGIHWNKPADKNPVFTIDSSSPWESVYITSPFVLKQGNIYKMWYSGAGPEGWQIGYAENVLPEPTATPTPTLTPTPSPTPTPLQPLILLPGLGGGWNHQEIFLGIKRPQSEWYKTPFRDDYNGLIKILQNAGYTLNQDLFVFYYNWLQPINQSADELKDYINDVVNPPPETKVDLIGHSLGGLVARTYIQRNSGTHRVDQLITLGSPHKGAPQVYKAWEGADLTGLLGEKERIGAGIIL